MKILHPLVKRFIAGYNFDSAKPVIDKLLDQGYEVSIDYLGELSKTKEDCRAADKQYHKILEFYKDKKIDISIKPSQLGLLLDFHFCKTLLRDIAATAKRHNHTIRLDMEDARVTQDTIKLALLLNDEFKNVGIAIQSNLFRTEKDLEILIRNNISVRLVKGAYKENKEIAYQKDDDVNLSFFSHACTLYSEKANRPAVATHDEELLEDIEELIPTHFENEFLYGIRRDLQRKFLQTSKAPVRIYVPFGEQWFPYILRRLKEWKNLKFVVRNVLYELFK